MDGQPLILSVVLLVIAIIIVTIITIIIVNITIVIIVTMQGCEVGPGGVAWPEWAQCIPEALDVQDHFQVCCMHSTSEK